MSPPSHCPPHPTPHLSKSTGLSFLCYTATSLWLSGFHTRTIHLGWLSEQGHFHCTQPLSIQGLFVTAAGITYHDWYTFSIMVRVANRFWGELTFSSILPLNLYFPPHEGESILFKAQTILGAPAPLPVRCPHLCHNPSNRFLTSVSLPLRESPPGIRKKYGRTMHVLPGGSDGQDSACDVEDPGLIPRSKRSPGEGNGNPLQYSFLENSVVRGAWWATVHGVTKSQTKLRD